MKKPYLQVLLVLSCLLGAAANVPAQNEQSVPEVSSTPISAWSTRVDRIAERLGKPKLTDENLSQLRDELETIRGEARKWITGQAQHVETAQKELEALGPPPGEGEEPEAISSTGEPSLP